MGKLEEVASRLDEISQAKKFQRIPNNVDFISLYQESQKEYANIKTANQYRDVMEEFLEKGLEHSGATLPFVKTHEQIRFRPGEVTQWHGFNGHKKSMFLGYAALNFMDLGEPVCIASFEMQPKSTIRRMLCQAAGTIEPTKLALSRFLEKFGHKFWIYDKQGVVSPEVLYGVIVYSAKELGVKHFIIDSLMRVVAGDDDYNAQKDFVVKLCDLALQLNIHIHYVHHNRKGDESQPAGRYGAKGSGSLSDNVHNDLEVHQRHRKDDEGETDLPDMYLICDKQREGYWTGSIALWFHESSLQFLGTKNSTVRNWL